MRRSVQTRSIRFLCIAAAFVAIALTDRFFGIILWASLVVPLANRRLGFYRGDSLEKIDEAMAREESESNR
jgi:hypothetical protein